MNDKLTPEQLAELIIEIERLSQIQEDELEREQVEQILQELNLPIDNLDRALAQLRRREALVIEERRTRRLKLGLGILLAVILGTGSFWFYQHQQSIAQVYANSNQSRLTLERYDSVNNLKVIDRQGYPTIYYQVKLQQTPIGQRLNLGCNWTNPLGQRAHQNNYKTRKIEKEVWNTRCRHQLGLTSPSGTWQVEMFLGDRILSKTEFTIN